MINWVQVIFDSAVTGSLYALAAVGLTLTYALSKFPNFAHAEFMTIGGYAGYVIMERLGFSFPIAILAAFLLAGITGLLSYRFLFGLLEKRGSGVILLMVASIALGIILRNILQQIFGAESKTFTPFWHRYTWDLPVGHLRANDIWLMMIAASLIMVISMHIFLTRTRTGKALRALANNPDLALASGVDVDRMLYITWFLGAALAGVAGLFRAWDSAVLPNLGWEILLPAFATAILGGIGSFYGAIIAAYILGFMENIGVAFLITYGITTEYRPAIAFIVLILTLIFKPRGLGTLIGE